MKKYIAIPLHLQKPVERLTAQEISELSNYGYIDMTQKEIADRLAEEGAFALAKAARDKLEKRQQALAAKWADPFTLLDDILERGIDAVKTERNQIKLANPKGD